MSNEVFKNKYGAIMTITRKKRGEILKILISAAARAARNQYARKWRAENPAKARMIQKRYRANKRQKMKFQMEKV